MSCPRLDAEKARAAQRDRLTGNIAAWTNEIGQADQRRVDQREKVKAAMDKAAAELATTGPAKQIANSDAKALATYLGMLGFEVDAERVNGWLVLLAVLVIECGGGLSLAVGMALSDRTTASPDHSQARTGTATVPQGDPWGETVPRRPATRKGKLRNLVDTTETALLRMLQDHGGEVAGGRRALGRNLGVSATQVNRVLDKLSAAGIVAVEATRRGSVIRLLVSGTA